MATLNAEEDKPEKRARSEDEADEPAAEGAEGDNNGDDLEPRAAGKGRKKTKGGKAGSSNGKKKSKDAILAEQGFDTREAEHWVSINLDLGLASSAATEPGKDGQVEANAASAPASLEPRSLAVECRGGQLGGVGSLEFSTLVNPADRGDLFANLAGSKPKWPIVASHGLRGRRQDLFFLLSLLLPLYPITFFDARGHGESAPKWIGAPADAFTWPAIASDVVAVADWTLRQPHLSEGAGKESGDTTNGQVLAVGKSMTCAATLHGLVDPTHRGKIAAAILYKVPTMGEGRRARAGDLAAQASGAKPPMDSVLAGVAVSDLPTIEAMKEMVPDSVPLLILSPIEDPNHPRESAEAVFDAIVGGRRERASGKAEESAVGNKEWPGIESKYEHGVELHAAPEDKMEELFRDVIKEWTLRVMGGGGGNETGESETRSADETEPDS